MTIQLAENDFLKVGEGKCADGNGSMFSFGQANGKGTESSCRDECGRYDVEGLVGFSVDATLEQCNCHYDRGLIPENWIGYTEENDGIGIVQNVVSVHTSPPTMSPSNNPSGIPSSLPSFAPSTEPSVVPSNLPSSIHSASPSVEPSGNPKYSIVPTQRIEFGPDNIRRMAALPQEAAFDGSLHLESKIFIDELKEEPSEPTTNIRMMMPSSSVACYAFMFPDWVPDWDDTPASKGFFEDICQDQAGRCSIQIFSILSFLFLPLCAACCCMRRCKQKTRGQPRDDEYLHDRLEIPFDGPFSSFRSTRSTPSTTMSILSGIQFGNSENHRKAYSFRNLRTGISEKLTAVSPEICQLCGESPAHYDRRLHIFKKRSELLRINRRKQELENEEKRLNFRENVLLKMEMTMLTNRNNLVFDDIVEKFHLQNVASDLANTNAHGMRANVYEDEYDLDKRLSSKTSKDVCAVCFNGFQFGDAICAPKAKHCKHVFHPECVEEWLQGSECCPLCQTNLVQ